MKSFNALTLSHEFMQKYVAPGAFCIDATAGRGGDTAFLSELVGDSGTVLAFDIQQEALDSTRKLLEEHNLSAPVTLILDSHANMANYAQPESVDLICFNFGWLPGGSHDIFTHTESSLAAIRAGLSLLKPNGVMSLCIYYGRNNGFEERDAILQYLRTLNNREVSVLICDFANRPNNPAIPVFLLKGV